MEDFFDYIYPIFFFVILPALIGILFFMIQYLLCQRMKNVIVKFIPFVVFLSSAAYTQWWYMFEYEENWEQYFDKVFRILCIIPMLCGIVFAFIVHGIVKSFDNEKYPLEGYLLLLLVVFVLLIGAFLLLTQRRNWINNNRDALLICTEATIGMSVFSLLFLEIRRLLKKHGKKKRKKT